MKLYGITARESYSTSVTFSMIQSVSGVLTYHLKRCNLLNHHFTRDTSRKHFQRYFLYIVLHKLILLQSQGYPLRKSVKMTDVDTLIVTLIPNNNVAERVFCHPLNADYSTIRSFNCREALNDEKLLEEELFPETEQPLPIVRPCLDLRYDQVPKARSEGWVFGSDVNL